jgi:beta-barrel assembly-enhancing protease
MRITGRNTFGQALAGSLLMLAFGTMGLSYGQAVPPPATDKAKIQETSLIPIPPDDDPEIRLGRENAEENDKQIKLLTDPIYVDRVNRIGQELAALANRHIIPALWGSPQNKQFKYSFKVVNDKDVNAYSLPGGFIYVNKGLLDFVRSDDELAGVLAHEVAHAAHHHMLKLLAEQKKIDRALLPLQLLAVALLASNTRSNVADFQALQLGTQLYSIARLNGYGIEAEKDADHMGFLLMTKSRYNPVGLFSFLNRLATQEKTRMAMDMGIFRTHPPSPERVEAAESLLKELSIPIRLSEVDPTLQLTVVMTKSGKDGAELAEIKMREVLLCRVGAEGTEAAGERARRLAKRLDSLFDNRLLAFEVRANKDQTRVTVRGITVLTANDAALQGKTIPELAKEMGDAVLLINQRRLSIN